MNKDNAYFNKWDLIELLGNNSQSTKNNFEILKEVGEKNYKFKNYNEKNKFFNIILSDKLKKYKYKTLSIILGYREFFKGNIDIWWKNQLGNEKLDFEGFQLSRNKYLFLALFTMKNLNYAQLLNMNYDDKNFNQLLFNEESIDKQCIDMDIDYSKLNREQKRLYLKICYSNKIKNNNIKLDDVLTDDKDILFFINSLLGIKTKYNLKTLNEEFISNVINHLDKMNGIDEEVMIAIYAFLIFHISYKNRGLSMCRIPLKYLKYNYHLINKKEEILSLYNDWSSLSEYKEQLNYLIKIRYFKIRLINTMKKKSYNIIPLLNEDIKKKVENDCLKILENRSSDEKMVLLGHFL